MVMDYITHDLEAMDSHTVLDIYLHLDMDFHFHYP